MEDAVRAHYIVMLEKVIKQAITEKSSPKDLAINIFNRVLGPAVEEEREAWVKMIYDRFDTENGFGGH